MARGVNETALPEPEDTPLPTKFEVRESIIALNMRASDFERGGMTAQAKFDRNVAKQLARLLAEVEHPSIGRVNAEIREKMPHEA